MNGLIVIDEIETKLNEINSSLTTKIDGINTNVAAVKTVVDGIATNTAVNNTGSTTGTLSQKLSSIISTLSTVNSNVNTLKNKSFCKVSYGSVQATQNQTTGFYHLNISGAWIASYAPYGAARSGAFIGYGNSAVDNAGTYYYISFSNN